MGSRRADWALVAVVATSCGGRSVTREPSDSVNAGAGSGGMANHAGRNAGSASTSGTGGAGDPTTSVDAGAGGDDTARGGHAGSAGASTASCSELALDAQRAVTELLENHRSCWRDFDCAWEPALGNCVHGCGYVLRESERSAVKAAAAELCRTFDERGCYPILTPCPAPPASVVCGAGTCVGRR